MAYDFEVSKNIAFEIPEVEFDDQTSLQWGQLEYMHFFTNNPKYWMLYNEPPVYVGAQNPFKQ